MKRVTLLLSAAVLSAAAFAVGWMTAGQSRQPARPQVPVRARVPPPLAKGPSVDAEILKATAEEAARERRYPEALAAVNKAISLAPDWAEAYAVRARIHAALAGTGAQAVQALEGTTWSGLSDGTSVQIRFLPGGVFRCTGDICPSETGRWTRDERSVRLDYDDGDAVEVGALEGNTLSGTGQTRSGGAPWTWSLSLRGAKPVSREQGVLMEASLNSASEDFETYLKLDPQASDRASVVLTIAQLRVRAAAIREARMKLE